MLEWNRFASERDFRGSSAKGALSHLREHTRLPRASLDRARGAARAHAPGVNVVDASSVHGLMLMRGTFSDVDGQVAPRLPS
jgi:hypothetical protein